MACLHSQSAVNYGSERAFLDVEGSSSSVIRTYAGNLSLGGQMFFFFFWCMGRAEPITYFARLPVMKYLCFLNFSVQPRRQR